MLASYSLTNAGRRHATSRSETKEILLTAREATEALCLLPVPLPPGPVGAVQSNPAGPASTEEHKA